MNVQAVMNKQIHPQRARLHVLAVDDDPVIREAISDYLGQYDFASPRSPTGTRCRRCSLMTWSTWWCWI